MTLRHAFRDESHRLDLIRIIQSVYTLLLLAKFATASTSACFRTASLIDVYTSSNVSFVPQ